MCAVSGCLLEERTIHARRGRGEQGAMVPVTLKRVRNVEMFYFVGILEIVNGKQADILPIFVLEQCNIKVIGNKTQCDFPNPKTITVLAH